MIEQRWPVPAVEWEQELREVARRRERRAARINRAKSLVLGNNDEDPTRAAQAAVSVVSAVLWARDAIWRK